MIVSLADRNAHQKYIFTFEPLCKVWLFDWILKIVLDVYADMRPSISSVLTVILCETSPPPRISPALIGSRCFIAKSLAGCNGGMGDEAEQGSRSDEKPVLGIS